MLIVGHLCHLDEKLFATLVAEALEVELFLLLGSDLGPSDLGPDLLCDTSVLALGIPEPHSRALVAAAAIHAGCCRW